MSVTEELARKTSLICEMAEIRDSLSSALLRSEKIALEYTDVEGEWSSPFSLSEKILRNVGENLGITNFNGYGGWCTESGILVPDFYELEETWTRSTNLSFGFSFAIFSKRTLMVHRYYPTGRDTRVLTTDFDIPIEYHRDKGGQIVGLDFVALKVTKRARTLVPEANRGNLDNYIVFNTGNSCKVKTMSGAMLTQPFK